MPEQTSFKQNTTVVLLNNAKVKLTALFAQIEAKKKKKIRAGFLWAEGNV